MLQITVHMCFTAREQAVRRQLAERRPASYSFHSGCGGVYTFSAATERCPHLTADGHQCLRGRLPRAEGTAANTCSADHGWLCCWDTRANPRRRCSFALAVCMPTTPRAATHCQCCPVRCAGRNPGAAPPCRRCYYYCRLKAYIVLTFLTLSGISPANCSRSGPKSVHMWKVRPFIVLPPKLLYYIVYSSILNWTELNWTLFAYNKRTCIL